VLESQRGQGVARQLISAVKDRAREAGSTELFWITRASNLRAQALYDKIAVKRDFIRYEIDLTPLEGDN
jgi:ribosomal protein S18 acetylase RimI-like enzyme